MSMYSFRGGPWDGFVIEYGERVAPDQDDAGRFDGNVGAGPDGDAHVGLHQGRRVVDAVADHRHELTLPLHLAHLIDLLRRQDLGEDLLNAEVGRDAPRRRPVVASEHDHLDAALFETPYRLL